MDKKTKLMAICAAGAAAILIGAGLARCAATPAEPEAAAPAAEEASAAPRPGRRGAFRLHGNHLGKRRTALRRSPCPSRPSWSQGEAGVQVMYYEVLSEDTSDEGLAAQISFTRSADEAKPRRPCSRYAPSADSAEPHLRRPRVVEELPSSPKALRAGYRAVRALLRAQRAPRCRRRRDRLRHSAEGILGVPDGNARHLGRRGLHRLQRGRPHDLLPPERRGLHHRAALARPRYRGAERAMRRVAAVHLRTGAFALLSQRLS